MVTPETIAELRALLAKATPGTWRAFAPDATRIGAFLTRDMMADRIIGEITRDRQGTADATLIAAAITALPALLDAADVASGRTMYDAAAVEREAIAAMVEALATEQAKEPTWTDEQELRRVTKQALAEDIAARIRARGER